MHVHASSPGVPPSASVRTVATPTITRPVVRAIPPLPLAIDFAVTSSATLPATSAFAFAPAHPRYVCALGNHLNNI